MYEKYIINSLHKVVIKREKKYMLMTECGYLKCKLYTIVEKFICTELMKMTTI